MEICDYNSCTGCAACMNNCKHQAISMYPDRHGELHPLIDVDKCIECGLCINRCPVNKHTERLEPQQCFAVWEKSLDDRKFSASGGVAAKVCQNAHLLFFTHKAPTFTSWGFVIT